MLEHEYPQTTQRSRFRYLFTYKHHGGNKSAAQWCTDLSEDDEFAVFDGADEMEISDEKGNLYGALSDGEESLRLLGNLREQIAKFPCAAEGSPWHGYPVWPLNNSRERTQVPAKTVFDKMVRAGLISSEMRVRLWRGDHV